MRKIDGRKAEITDAKKWYDLYSEFAVRHGYPDAVRNSKIERSTWKEPRNGDIVTLLVSGKHEWDTGELWIVEAADGKRHIIGEKGLRILNETIENVTVLPDESLGGLLREYREVKRKAAVGERIKVTYASHEWTGGPVTIDFIDHEGDPSWKAEDPSSTYYVKPDWYVVLEPTDIVRKDGERLRMVDQKATVGERVIVTKSNSNFPYEPYKVGGVYTVKYASSSGHINGTYEETFGISPGHYHVLKPVDAAPTAQLSAQPPTPLSERSFSDQAAANIAALTAKVQALESRVATLEKVNQPVKVAEGPADDAPPSFAIPRRSGKSFPFPAIKSPQQVRDEIVERAKADVKALLKQRVNNVPTLGGLRAIFNLSLHGDITDSVKFIVNSEKRTVTALIYAHATGQKPFVWARGIAKCAPNDVFNAHIGRAIALRRALGLEVPAEYLSVPNPEEPRVGDVVQTFYRSGQPHLTFKVVGIRGKKLFDKQHEYDNDSCYTSWDPEFGDRIIDDSREEVSA